MSFKYFFGWILIFTGVLIIFWSLYSSYNIFSAKIDAPEVFKIVQTSATEQKEIKKNGSISQEEMMKEIIGEQVKEMFPTAFLATFFNLIAWSFFAGISILAGSKICFIGIRLAKKPIMIKK